MCVASVNGGVKPAMWRHRSAPLWLREELVPVVHGRDLWALGIKRIATDDDLAEESRQHNQLTREFGTHRSKVPELALASILCSCSSLPAKIEDNQLVKPCG